MEAASSKCEKDMYALVIDSNPTDNASLVRLLQDSGFATVSVTSLADAHQALAQQAFDILLLETDLPDGYGGQFCYELRERLGYQLLIIFVSAQGTPHRQAVTLELGADDFVSKPYDQEELLMRIQALQRRQPVTGVAYSTVISSLA